jgi:Fe-S-cluster containining protein
MDNWEKYFGIKYPACKMTGLCCRMATPSTPAVAMLKKAAYGDSNARDFLSIFQPYDSIETVRELFPEFVEKALTLAEKSDKFKNGGQVVFFKCRYLKGKNQCLVYEDRPQLCRDYPDTPFLLMPPGCGFEEWSQLCKGRYKNMTKELNALKLLKEILDNNKMPPKKENKFVYSSFIVSPSYTWLKCSTKLKN